MKVILEGVVGSIAYGMSTPTSDIDKLGVYILPIDQLIGLHPPEKRSIVDSAPFPDRTLHEVGKFLKLCCAGNPTVMELLWLDSHTIHTVLGERLIHLRTYVLSETNVRNAYLGYAVQQARRLETRWRDGKTGFNSDLAKRTPKHGRHCFRLLWQAETLLTEGRIQIHVGDQRDRIFAAGQLADTDPEAFVKLFESERDRIQNVKSVLPRVPDYQFVDEVLVDLRWENHRGG